MASSPLEALRACAHAIQDRNLELADSLLGQIWKLAADLTDEKESDVVKYFAEALVRRAYGLHPPFAGFYLQRPLLDFPGFNSWFGRIEGDALMGKKRLHIIDFYVPHLYTNGFYFTGISAYFSSDIVAVRVSVVLPPFLEGRVDVQQEQQYLTTQAKYGRVELREFKVIYANSLGEVDDDELDLRRTEDEGVVVHYNSKLHRLVAEAGAMERELLKLRQIKPDIVLLIEQNANHNDSNFINRLEQSYPYYSQDWTILDPENYIKRREIGNIVGCEGRERVERYLTLAQWRSLFLTAGFLPLPLKVFSGEREENGCVVVSGHFMSAWKLNSKGAEQVNTESYNNNNNNNKNNVQGLITPIPLLLEDIVHPIPVLVKGLWLNRLAAFAEILDMFEDVCCKYGLPLALTWVGVANKIGSDLCNQHALSLETNYCFTNTETEEYIPSYLYLRDCGERKRHLVAGQGIAGKALQSDEPFLFEPSITELKGLDYPFASAALKFGSRAAVAICVQNQHTSDDVYVLELFFPKTKIELVEKRNLAHSIFDSFENMKTKFIRLRVNCNTEVGLQKKAVSNINPYMTMAVTSSMPALHIGDFLKTDEPREALNQQGVVIPNLTSVDISTISLPSICIDAFSPLDGTIPISNQQIWPHEQENGDHTSLRPIENNENVIAKEHTYKLPNSSAKRRKLTSNVWEEFYKEKEYKDGKAKTCAICSHCNRKFDGSSKKGTTHLRNHLNRCKSRAAKVMGDEDLIVPPQRGVENQGVGEYNSSFDQDRSRLDVARMVIKNQYPLNIVEEEFFSILLKNLQPMFKLQSQEALASHILDVYKEEKGRLIEYFGKLSCRLNLTINFWIDDLEKITYYCFGVQFVDDSWVLKKKIIALKALGHEHEFEPSIFFENFKSLLVDWNFDKKICSLTVHNADSSSLEIAEEIRENWSCFEASYPLSTFYISCDGCNNDLFAKYKSDEIDDGVIKTSTACLLDILDAYKKQSLRERRDYPLMNVKSNNNWRRCSLVLTIAAILDPRFKFDVVEFSYEAIYGYDSARIHLTMIRNALTDIFNEYASNMYGGFSLLDDNNSCTSLNVGENTMEAFQRWRNSKRKVTNEAPCNSELYKYLQAPSISSQMDKFDVLGWWCEHALEFPILGRMARDILAIPMSTIISGFPLKEKVMMDNPIFRGLDPQITEAMICGKDWLESPKEKPNMTENNSCFIVELKDRPQLVYHSALEHFSSKSNIEAPPLPKEDLGSKARAWSRKDVRAYLISRIRKEELESELKQFTISGEHVGPDRISHKALADLLMIPPSDVCWSHTQNYYIEDTVVNQFFILLKRRYEEFPNKYVKHHSFDSSITTFLIDKLKTGSEVLSWVKQEDLKGMSKLFLPMCLHNHWLLFCADIDNKRLLWLDSKQESRMSYKSEMHVIFQWFFELLLYLGYDQPDDWLCLIPTDIPEQKNSVDCGLFVMKYADCLTHGDYLPFTQADMPYFRHRTFLDLCRGRIHSGSTQA